MKFETELGYKVEYHPDKTFDEIIEMARKLQEEANDNGRK